MRFEGDLSICICSLKRCNHELTVFCQAQKIGLLAGGSKKEANRAVIMGPQLLGEGSLIIWVDDFAWCADKSVSFKSPAINLFKPVSF